MGTQWRIGTNGVIGLDYSALDFVFKTLGFKKKRWGEIFDDIRVLEGVALEELRKG